VSVRAQPLTAGTVLTTVWFWLVFALSAPLCVVLGTLLFLVTAPWDGERRALHAFICRWTFNYLRASPLWRARVRGRERLPRGPCVLVANHQSMADPVAAMGLFHPFKFVSKVSLFSLPAVGWLMSMARYVRLERRHAGSTRRMMIACRRWLRHGVPVLIFPEGTYSPGPELLPFKRGAFVLAVEERVPLVPIAIRGTGELVRGDGPWLNVRSRIDVEVLPPLHPDAVEGDPAALLLRAREQLGAALGTRAHLSTRAAPSHGQR
jgi:1-acyl-sn-glycerol-3-phosphate acyltransferase